MSTSFQNTVTVVTVNTTAPVAVGAPTRRQAWPVAGGSRRLSLGHTHVRYIDGPSGP